MKRHFRACCLSTSILVLVVFGGLTLWGLLTGGVPAAPDFPPETQPALDLAVEHYGLPAMAVAIVHSDKIEVAVSGVRAHGRPDRVQPGDLWHLGSNTKAFTASLIALLVAQGKLSWDTTPADVWPDWEVNPQFRTVTLRQLLYHRAGVPAFTSGAEAERLPDFTGDTRARRLEFAKYILARKPARKTGQYVYSNAGYSVAAAMAEQATGQSYEELIQARLLRPLGLTGHMSWPVKVSPAQPSGHYGYGPDYEVHDISDGYEVPDYLDPAGELSLSIGDYARWLQLHLRGLQGRSMQGADGKPFALTPAMIADLHKPAEHPRDDESYSCGWIEEVPMAGADCSSHDGSLGTFYCTAYVQPSRDIAVAVITNAGDERATSAVHAVVEAVLEEEAP